MKLRKEPQQPRSTYRRDPSLRVNQNRRPNRDLEEKEGRTFVIHGESFLEGPLEALDVS